MLELKNLTFKAAGRTILDRLNYIFLPDKLYVVTGANGSGKSTLARLIMGLEKPKTGEIYLDKKPITKLNITKRAQLGIGLAFQQPIGFKGITVRDLLNLATNSIDDKFNINLLARVGLEASQYLNREVNNKLSGGELKRIELATTLARQPKIAIFDEPEAGIDLWSFAQLVQVFQDFKGQDRAIIIISHQDKMLQLADKILLLDSGKMVEYENYRTFAKQSKVES